MEYCGARRGDKLISLNPVERYVSPLFSLLLVKEMSSTSSNTTINATRFKTGIKQLERWNIIALAGGIHSGT